MSVARKDVLVVSDSASTGKQVVTSLADSGYDVIVVSTEDDCLTRIQENAPVLVFLGLGSTAICADTLLSRIREVEPELPVVLMCGQDCGAELVPLLEAGATDYVLFPVVHPSLISFVVKRNIDRRRETRKRKRSERELKKLNRALVDSLKVLEQDQQAGSRVQQGMMPESPFQSKGITLSHTIVPSLILSGDFIDYFELPDQRLLFYIADVSGHGTSGAIVTVLLKSLSSRLYNEFDELGFQGAGEILGWINRELLTCGLEQHVTMFLGLIDNNGRRLQYGNAAQFPAAILSAGGATGFLEMGGLPLGIYDTARYQSRTVALPAEFALVMFSDGVFEIMNEASLTEKEEHLRSLVECGHRDVGSLTDHLGLSEVKEVPDDIAVFTVARSG